MDKINDFLKNEVGFFHDGIIRKIHVDYSKRMTKVVLSVESIEDWINVELDFIDVAEFNINQSTNYNNDVVLTLGIKVSKFDNLYFFDFSPTSYLQEDIEEYRNSKCYFACEKYAIIKKEYEE